MKADGGSLDTSTAFDRVSGGPSLAGKWKTKKVTGAAGAVEMTASGPDGLIFKDPFMAMSCDAKLDGKDYPCTGPLLAPGFTVAMKPGSRSLDITVKKDGQPYFNATFAVAADGKSMTETEAATSGGDKFKIVYDRM